MAQIEEIGFDQFWKRKDELLDALGAYRRKRSYYFSAMLVTDVTTQCSLLLVADSDDRWSVWSDELFGRTAHE